MIKQTGDYNLKYNMQNLLRRLSIFLLEVMINATKIDNLGGLQYDGIQDVEYLRDKLFAALKGT